MIFPCVLLLCAALLKLGVGESYKAEVYVVASNPQEYGVSVVATTNPPTVVTTIQDANDPKPQAVTKSSHAFSSSSSSQDNNSPLLPKSSDPSSGVNHEVAVTGTSKSPLGTSASNKGELLSPTTQKDTSTLQGQVPPQARLRPVHASMTQTSSSAEQSIPGDNCCDVKENCQLMRNVGIQKGEKTDLNSKTNRGLNGQTTCYYVSPKYTPACKTRTQSNYQTPPNYSETSKRVMGDQPSNETPATNFTVNNTVTEEHITLNVTSESQGSTSHPIINKTEPSQPTTLQSVSTDQKSNRIPQTPIKQENISDRPLINQSAIIQQHSTNQSVGPVQAIVNQMLVLPPNPTNKTESIQKPRDNHTEVPQPILTVPSNVIETKQPPNNQTESNRPETPKKQEVIKEIPNNRTGLNTTEIPSKQEITHKIPNTKTEFNQTKILTNQTETGQEIPSNQTESILFEIRKLRTNHTSLPRSLNTTQGEHVRKRRKRSVATDKLPLMGNRREFNQTEIFDKNPNGTSFPRAHNHTWRRARLERLERRRRPMYSQRRREHIKKPNCTCVEDVIERTAKCKRPCTRTAQLTDMLFTHAFVIFIVYVVLLTYVYRKIRCRRKELEEWRRDAIRWKCRERGTKWFLEMFS